MHPTAHELASFDQFFTPLVSDVMDRLGIPSHVLPRDVQCIPFDPSLKVAGLAFPCRVVPTNVPIVDWWSMPRKRIAPTGVSTSSSRNAAMTLSVSVLPAFLIAAASDLSATYPINDPSFGVSPHIVL